MSLRHGILGLLSIEPGSGYDLLSTFQETLANVWPATQSQLYGELNKLANDGLIQVASTGARGRKEYELTDAGAKELHHWMTEVQPKRVARNDMLLRVFFLGLLPHDEAVALLERERTVIERYRGELEKIEEETPWDANHLAANGRIALEWGLRFTKMHLEWVDWAISRLDSASQNN